MKSRDVESIIQSEVWFLLGNVTNLFKDL